MSSKRSIAEAGGAVSSTALSLTDAPFSFTADQLANASSADFFVSDAGINIRTDGNAPTTAALGGGGIPAGAVFTEHSKVNLSNLQLIVRDPSSDGLTANVWVRLEK